MDWKPYNHYIKQSKLSSRDDKGGKRLDSEIYYYCNTKTQSSRQYVLASVNTFSLSSQYIDARKQTLHVLMQALHAFVHDFTRDLS